MLKILERFTRKGHLPPGDSGSVVRHTFGLSRAVRHRGLNIVALRRNRAKAKRAGRSRRINRKRASR